MLHKSIMWKISRDELLEVVKNSFSLNEVLKKFNLSGSAFYTLKKRLQTECINLNELKIKTKKEKTWRPTPLFEMLIENSNYSRSSIKNRIIKSKLIDYKCNFCGCGSKWHHKPLVLILDHINGVRNDHRLENLRFLCPNCNSQTETFAGRNNKLKFEQKFCLCGVKIKRCSNNCLKCAMKSLRKVIRPEKECLSEMLWKEPTSTIAKKFGVSDSSVAKWARQYGLSKPPRGYWHKFEQRI